MSGNNYLREAFKSMKTDDVLNEEAFTLDSKGADELKQFLDGDDMDDSIQVIDTDAKTPEELEDSYIGKVILDCCVCHSKLYKDKEDVVIDEDGDLANVDEECPFCYCVDGFKIVGEVKEFNKDDSEEDKDEEEDKEEEDEVEVEETEEEKIEESFSSEEKIEEAPNYELRPQYDSRQSFYGKARVDTGDKDDKNKLFSYDTLVAEIKDGKPVVYGTFSATTLRHIKDWLKQNGFKAENKAQILRDYGVKEEAKKCEEKECEDGKCKKEECKEDCKESVTESVEEVSVKTDKEDISVKTDEQGKVSVETSVREETDEGAEEIAPVSDEVKAEIEDDSEAEIGDEIDVEMTDFDEESFDELGEAYLKKAYSNVDSYKSVSATANDNRITVEGVIKFKSGNEKKTKFVLESKEVTKSGKSRFVGENLQIAKGKKSFTILGTLSEGKFVTESFGYDYKTKDKSGKLKRISGTVTKR